MLDGRASQFGMTGTSGICWREQRKKARVSEEARSGGTNIQSWAAIKLLLNLSVTVCVNGISTKYLSLNIYL